MSGSLTDLAKKSLAVRNHYNDLQQADGNKIWNAQDRVAGFVGDVGDLSKLVMAKYSLRRGPENIDSALKHELSDCLWSILIIADELNIDLEEAFDEWIDEMHERIEKEKAEV